MFRYIYYLWDENYRCFRQWRNWISIQVASELRRSDRWAILCLQITNIHQMELVFAPGCLMVKGLHCWHSPLGKWADWKLENPLVRYQSPFSSHSPSSKYNLWLELYQQPRRTDSTLIFVILYVCVSGLFWLGEHSGCNLMVSTPSSLLQLLFSGEYKIIRWPKCN